MQRLHLAGIRRSAQSLPLVVAVVDTTIMETLVVTGVLVAVVAVVEAQLIPIMEPETHHQQHQVKAVMEVVVAEQIHL